MSLLPANDSETLDEYLDRISDDEAQQQPSKTYALNFDTGRIGGMLDDREALMQFIRKAIVTERSKWRIYSDDYGCELSELLGQDVTTGFIESEVPRMVTEAIEYDDRIMAVNNVTASRQGDAIFITCDVSTIFGDVDVEAVI